MVGQLNNRLLLVDDEEVIRKLIARQFVAAGYVVRTAEDGLDAIAKLRAGSPDLIISDLDMPGMSGFEFLAVVRKRFPQIPVIAFSSIPKDEIPEGLVADAYCTKKNFQFDDLLATASALAGRPSPRPAPLPVVNEAVKARWDGTARFVVGCGDCCVNSPYPESFAWGEMKGGRRASTAGTYLSSSWEPADRSDQPRAR